MQVRLLQPDHVPRPTATAAGAPAPQDRESAPDATRSTGKQALSGSASRSTPKAPAGPGELGTGSTDAAANPPAVPQTPTSGDDDYVPRPLLSVPPVALAPVIIGEPAGEAPTGRLAGVVSLFIDDQGQVRRVVAEPPYLPPAFEQAARDAFMATRFSPGQLDGQTVKARVRVEVVFDDTPLVGR
ncbi:hypothetical protein [Variovorax sp. HW608]|uniref:hypothetical protein n=1 Tax=Variovorax sp. HW608 TaxID=1034889 RepID=UPI0012FE4A8E|nr:hypothetical protein [Variovorax sp. HW608]